MFPIAVPEASFACLLHESLHRTISSSNIKRLKYFLFARNLTDLSQSGFPNTPSVHAVNYFSEMVFLRLRSSLIGNFPLFSRNDILCVSLPRALLLSEYFHHCTGFRRIKGFIRKVCYAPGITPLPGWLHEYDPLMSSCS